MEYAATKWIKTEKEWAKRVYCGFIYLCAVYSMRNDGVEEKVSFQEIKEALTE